MAEDVPARPVASGGPWLQAAVFCENVIQDREGVLSLIRVVDRVIIRAVGDTPPAEVPETEHELRMVVMLKSGDARGRRGLQVDMESPDGITRVGPPISVQLEGGNRGMNVIVPMRLRLRWEGVHWVNVWLDDQLLTRMPLQVVYQPTVTRGA